jgi:hypothetical protein
MPSTLSADEIAAMQATQATYLPDTCTILAPGTARTATGGVADTLGTVAANVPCRFRQIAAGQKVRHGGVVLEGPMNLLTLPASVSLLAVYQIAIGGKTWNVQNDNSDDTWRTATRAELIPQEARPLR